jgi:hypothetical protein
MPTLISETDVSLERRDLERRVVLARSVGPDGFIVPPARRAGLHLSGLLKCVAHASRLAARVAEVQDEEMPLRWALGHAWEEFAASLYPDMVWQPGEVEDPVVMNCDGIEIREEPVVMEFKHNRAKRYTGADLIKKKWLWMCQGMGYCIGYGAELVEWHVISMMEFPDPVYTKYLVRFSDDELDGMRNMIEINKAGAIAAGFAE